MRTPIRTLPTLTVLTLVASAAVSFGQTAYTGSAYDGLDYTAGVALDSSLNGGTGFTTAWGSNSSGGGATTSAGSLDYTDSAYPDETGGKAFVDGTSGSTGMGRELGQDINSGTFYFSFLTQKTIDSPRSLNVAFFGATNGSERFAIGSHTTASPGNFVLTYNGGGGTNQVVATSPIAYAVDQTYLVVGRVDFDFNGALDRVTIYIDPASLTDEGSLTPYIQDTSMDLTNVLSFRMFAGGGSTGIAAGYFDEFRFGDTYAAVTGAVPEPATWASLLGVVCLGWAIRRKRSA